jgi:hypothetical protein
MKVSGRLIRAFLRTLKERVGDAPYEELARSHPLAATPPAGSDWIPLGEWLPLLDAFERRFGDPASLQLTRETTRATMAVAVQRGWAVSRATVTHDGLLARADEFWRMSYDTGHLAVGDRGPRHVSIQIQGWPDVPPVVVASVAEACVVFLVGLGERGARAVDQGATVQVSW